MTRLELMVFEIMNRAECFASAAHLALSGGSDGDAKHEAHMAAREFLRERVVGAIQEVAQSSDSVRAALIRGAFIREVEALCKEIDNVETGDVNPTQLVNLLRDREWTPNV